MRVSVIIPTFNRAEKLKRSVASVLNQSFQDFELIVVDDGSTDDTRKWLEKEKEKHKQLKTIYQENAGVSAARNAGIAVAQGEWLSFLDSDDEWLSDKLEKQIEYIR